MPRPLFEFFETVAEELCIDDSRVITRFTLQVRDNEAPILDDLKRDMRASTTERAIELAVEQLGQHFQGKSSSLPFLYDAATGRFTATDRNYLTFVKEMRSIRSLGNRSRDFECGVAERLRDRATGELHRVGDPRDKKKTRGQFNGYLKRLGFDRPVLHGGRGDGGFDILWVLPLGTIPRRPMVSVQCKNGEFEMEAADKSTGAARRSFGQHAGLLEAVHVLCVLFNDYVTPDNFRKPLDFVPLGLTDLATINTKVSLAMI